MQSAQDLIRKLKKDKLERIERFKIKEQQTKHLE